MKKIILLVCAALILFSLSACVEHIEDNSPTKATAATKPTDDAPLPVIDPTDIPDDQKADPTEPTASDPDTDKTDPTAPTDTQPIEGGIVVNNITDPDPKNEGQGLSRSGAISVHPKNAAYAGDGTIVSQEVSGNSIKYRVKYTETLSMVVDVTAVGDNLTVTASLEHYKFFFGAGKPVTVQVGNYQANLETPSISWDSNDTPALSPIFSVTASADGASSVKIKFAIPYNGTYHGEKIESFSFEQELNISRE